MERSMRSVRITRAKNKTLNENIDSSLTVEKKTAIKNPQEDRNILGDQTNTTPSPAKRTCLRNLSRPNYSTLSGKKNKMVIEQQIDSSISGKTIRKQAEKTRGTVKQRKSVMKNSETEEKKTEETNDKATKDEFVVKKRPRRLDNKVSSAISDPVTVESRSALEVSTFYGSKKPRTPATTSSTNKSSKVPIYKLQNAENASPRVCVYKTNEPEKPNMDVDRLALYEFEVDSSEEAKLKKTKKRKVASSRVKPRTTAGNKGMFKPKTVSHNVKKNILQPKHTTPKNFTSAVLSIVKATPISPKPASNLNSISHQVKVSDKPTLPSQILMSPQSISASLLPHQANKLSASSMDNTLEAAAYSDESFSAAGHLGKSIPSLQSLFDEEDSQFNSMQAFTSHDSLKPIRFEYNELAQARAKGQARKSIPVVKIPQEEKELSDETGSHLRQTSIRNFLSGNLNQSASSGLFSTGASTEDPTTQLVSSTPQRPNSRLRALSPLLSPVTEVLSTRSSARIQARTPTKQQVGTEIASTPRNRTPSKESLVSVTPLRVSPRKLSTVTTPEKVIADPPKGASHMKSSPEKAYPEKKKPTRFSAGSLRAALKSNLPAEIPPLLLPPAFPSDEDLEQTEVPVSPKRNFDKPARKSYERRPIPKPALNFMELEEAEDNVVDPIEEYGGDAEEHMTTKAHHRTHHKKPKGDENEDKRFEEWASRFNSEIEQVEEFPLAVE